MTDNQGNLLSTWQMAERLKVTQKWLRDEASSGRIPAIPAGPQFLFNARAVEDVLEERAAQGEVSSCESPKEGQLCS